MKSLIIKDQGVRRRVSRGELKRIGQKVMNTDMRVTSRSTVKGVSRVRIKNRCLITGRARAVDRWFRMSRIQIRLGVQMTRIGGVKKGSW